MAGTVAVVTDSTASLAPDREGGCDLDIRVVPLQFALGGHVHDETSAAGIDVPAALRSGVALTTSRPSPERFARVYAEAAVAGAPGIVSVHLSGRMSGTVDSARLAAAAAPVPVLVVDTRTVGAGLGFAVLSAAAAARAGRTLGEVAAAAARRSDRMRSLFCLGTLDQIRRGGRIDGAGAQQGTALTVKRLMRIVDGQIVPFEKVRTTARAVARLEQLAAEFAASAATPAAAAAIPGATAASAAGAAGGGSAAVDVAVQHVGNGELAARLAQRLRVRIPRLRTLQVSEAGPVMAVHTGPDMLGVVVAPD